MPSRHLPDRGLAKTVRRVREQRGMTREALAHDAGLTVGTLARIELGQADPKWTTVRDIAEALGVSLSSLARTAESEG